MGTQLTLNALNSRFDPINQRCPELGLERGSRRLQPDSASLGLGPRRLGLEFRAAAAAANEPDAETKSAADQVSWETFAAQIGVAK